MYVDGKGDDYIKVDEIVAALLVALDDDYNDVRAAAASALGEIGPAAKEAVPMLIATMQDMDPNVRRNATVALGRIGGPAVAALQHMLTTAGTNPFIRAGAAEALGQIGKHAERINESIADATV